MSRIILITVSIFLLSGTCIENIYNRSVITIEGVNKPLGAYQGKKLLIVTLPLEQNASSDSLLHSLDSIGTVNTASLVVIAVPSFEDGYTAVNKEALKQWYRSIMGSQVVVTEGMYTRKTSGTQQHPLFKWLTNKGENGHFDRDVDGPGNKFIVWTNGELIGVLGSLTKMNSSVINELLQ